MLVIKKYGNRRLYDTEESKFITLEELATRIRGGADVQVLDARTNKDLTQATLAQVILESRGAAKLLPVQLLTQLVRMEDEALGEFFGRFIGTALEFYFQARQGAQGLFAYNPFLSRLPFGGGRQTATAAPSNGEHKGDDVAALRRDLDDLKRKLKRKR